MSVHSEHLLGDLGTCSKLMAYNYVWELYTLPGPHILYSLSGPIGTNIHHNNQCNYVKRIELRIQESPQGSALANGRATGGEGHQADN